MTRYDNKFIKKAIDECLVEVRTTLSALRVPSTGYRSESRILKAVLDHTMQSMAEALEEGVCVTVWLMNNNNGLTLSIDGTEPQCEVQLRDSPMCDCVITMINAIERAWLATVIRLYDDKRFNACGEV